MSTTTSATTTAAANFDIAPKRLVSGASMPSFGLGTWRSDKGKVAAAVEHAITLGYRHIDAAAVYLNHDEVGAGIRAAIDSGVVTRDELFVTSKLWLTDFRPEAVRPAAERALAELGLDYLDLYLLHWPVALQPQDDSSIMFPKDDEQNFAVDDVPHAATWTAVEALVAEGLVRDIGVSNFSIAEVAKLLETAQIRPSMNQVESHPYLNQNELRAYLEGGGIHLTAYSPLGNLNPAENAGVSPLQDEVVLQIAGKHNKSAAQVLIRWSMQKGNVVIPKSTTLSRLEENFSVFDFALDAEDLEQLERLNTDKHFINPPFRAGGQTVF